MAVEQQKVESALFQTIEEETGLPIEYHRSTPPEERRKFHETSWGRPMRVHPPGLLHHEEIESSLDPTLGRRKSRP